MCKCMHVVCVSAHVQVCRSVYILAHQHLLAAHPNIPLDDGWPLVARVGVAILEPSWDMPLIEYPSVGGALPGFWMVLN